MVKGKRIDQLLIDNGLMSSLDQARASIIAGEVYANGQLVVNPSEQVAEDADLRLQEGSRYVSRGGEKLKGALDAFGLDLRGIVCADVGASTGGFTDCLLQAGSRRVYAIDVGYGILDWKLRNDKRVIVMERTNARYLEQLPEEVDLVTIDVSFISIKKILPAARQWLKSATGQMLVLIKPQFEASRAEAACGKGVITDPEIHKRVIEEVIRAGTELGLQTAGLIPSPLLGPDGNREFLVWFKLRQEGENQTKDPDWISDFVLEMFPLSGKD
jgi:23S rRNA (cytidine1920-2'-O)/16S rRNA (cytidine1409-2'-O)-methyltransferase